MRRLIFVLILFSLWFCGDKKTPSTTRAKILTLGESGIEYKVAEFRHLTDVVHMDGTIATILGGSVIDYNLSLADVISGDPNRIFKRKGSTVHLDYTVIDGVITAQNQDSLAMLSVYHAFEGIVEFWTEQYHFTHKEIGKFKIHFDPSFAASSDDMKLTITPRMNASYFTGLGDFLLNKTSPNERIPIKMNPAVLAHEFGHKIVDILFVQKDPDFYSTKSWQAQYKIQGINEGLADFFSWLYVQKTNLYTLSLDINSMRDRKIPVPWTMSQLRMDASLCTGRFYCEGSVLNSALYSLSKESAFTPQIVANATLRGLRKLRLDWQKYRDNDDFDYFYLLNRIVQELPAESQKTACSIFKKLFDDEVNQSGLKQACP